jgi:predicted MFS family arabinose efflux permease
MPRPSLASLRGTPAIPILIAISVVMSLGMGLRQSLGLFMAPAVKDLSITVADFTLAIAVQNLAWGFLQPVAGAFAERFGFRPVLTAGAAAYVAGLALLASASGVLEIVLGAGVLIGAALACTAAGMGMAVASRPVPVAVRSTVLGVVSAAGSLGALISAPLGQVVAEGMGWRAGVLAFVVLALAMLPAAWIAGRVDKVPVPPSPGGDAGNARAACRMALRHPPFLIMAGAYFICGLQLVFLTTHLPSYLILCGMDPMLGAQALAVIGGFNIAGSLFFGWAGGRWSKPALLGGLYICRSLVLAWYFAVPPTPGSTLVFAALMGFLWLGVAPLVAGMTAEMFGLRWQAMIQGLAFMSHQIGSTLGAFGGGLLFDAYGDYALAVKLGIGMGLVAGTIQLLASVPRWPGPRLAGAG